MDQLIVISTRQRQRVQSPMHDQDEIPEVEAEIEQKKEVTLYPCFVFYNR